MQADYKTAVERNAASRRKFLWYRMFEPFGMLLVIFVDIIIDTKDRYDFI